MMRCLRSILFLAFLNAACAQDRDRLTDVERRLEKLESSDALGLQERCARQAEVVLRTLPPGQQMAMRPTLDLQTSSATSHYSAKLGRCFVELRFVTLEPWSISVKLLDAFEPP